MANYVERAVVGSEHGLHARPASVLVQTVNKYLSERSSLEIYLIKRTKEDDEKINAASIMGIFTLAASYGTELEINVSGDYELDVLKKYASNIKKIIEADLDSIDSLENIL